jgi:hypothetical protein
MAFASPVWKKISEMGSFPRSYRLTRTAKFSEGFRQFLLPARLVLTILSIRETAK